MPYFSIIVPVYKTELYLEKCLKSLKSQIFTDFECLVINDGSPGVDFSQFDHDDLQDAESTLDLSKTVATEQVYNIFQFVAQNDPRFKLTLKDNQGLSPTKNLGLKLATGKRVVILDSDDFLELDFLEKAFQALETKSNNLIYYGDLKTLERGIYGNFKDSQKYLPQKNDLKNLLVFPTWSVTPICYFWPLEIIGKYNIEFKKTGEDTVFVLENILAHTKEYGQLSFEKLDIYYIYRQFPNQMSKGAGFEIELFKCTTSFVKSILGQLAKLGLIYKVLGMLFVLRFSIYRERLLTSSKFKKLILAVLAKGLTILAILLAGTKKS